MSPGTETKKNFTVLIRRSDGQVERHTQAAFHLRRAVLQALEVHEQIFGKQGEAVYAKEEGLDDL